MKKAILTLAALAAFSTSASAQEVLRVGTEGAYAPWNFVNDAGELAGFEIDLANAICEQTGMTCEIVQNDWDSIIPNLVAGNYDTIMAGMSITEERLESINFTQDYFPVDPSKYIALADADLDLENPSGLRIGVQGNTIQAAYAEENFGAIDVKLTDSQVSRLDQLINQNTVHGARYNEATQKEIDTEQF